MNWNDFISVYWALLARGERIAVSASPEQLEAAGFRRFSMAMSVGQIANWALPLTDRSRLHIHQFENGAMVVHRDKHDPGLGPLDLAAHLLTETFVGPVLGVAGVLMLAASLNDG